MVHHVVSALTMTKLTNFSMKNENDALLLATLIKHNIGYSIVKEQL